MDGKAFCPNCGAACIPESTMCPTCGYVDRDRTNAAAAWGAPKALSNRWKAVVGLVVAAGIIFALVRFQGIMTRAADHVAASAAASAAAIHWPTVREARTALTAAGHDLVLDTSEPANPRWTGPDPLSSRIDIVGEDTDPAVLTLTIVMATDDLGDTKDFLGILPDPIHTTTALTFGDAIQGSTVDPEGHITRSAKVPHGRVDVDVKDGVCVVVLRPDAGTA
jgi:hypothetical protein